MRRSKAEEELWAKQEVSSRVILDCAIKTRRVLRTKSRVLRWKLVLASLKAATLIYCRPSKKQRPRKGGKRRVEEQEKETPPNLGFQVCKRKRVMIQRILNPQSEIRRNPRMKIQDK